MDKERFRRIQNEMERSERGDGKSGWNSISERSQCELGMEKETRQGTIIGANRGRTMG